MLSPPGALVRRHDPDRFLTALFAPAERREALFALYAFNHELARAREVASEPGLVLIRLHWWREVVEGAPRRHEVAEPLAAALASGALDRADLLGLIDAREIEAEAAIPDLDAWRAYVLGTAGAIAAAAGRALGAGERDREMLRLLGGAYGAAGVLRSLGAVARQGRCLLPETLLRDAGLSPEAAMANPVSPALRPVLETLTREGIAWLHAARGFRPGRTLIAAALPAVLARRDLRRGAGRVRPRGLADRLAVTIAGLAARI